MLKERQARDNAFFTHLKEMVPFLTKLSKNCQVIWLNQFPTLEFYGGTDSANTDVHEGKIWHYNREINRILMYVIVFC